ncbi:hypothetical protein B0H19DRAFT_1317633 [Mycena capillaripes]|nr:hypothetical protein B0H19DRAFT_1317633 [Mycena capillaripes]
MRQQKQSTDDDKLRRALENMRYAACTEQDIAFLETRVAGFRPGNPQLSKGDLRNVSIITSRNSQKDALNKMGAERFARDTSQDLIDFCSIDRISARSVDKNKWKGCVQSEIKKMSRSLQQKLWDALPSTTNEFIPGKLTLCLGMPIMLRANDATELCMTKGQEAVVCGWDSSEGPAGQRVLDTLFVRLVNPPRTIKIENLPENVVPLVRTVTHVTCLLSDDTLLSVLREQVVCLLNFGMTDYTSQGKSRAKNLVELAYCKNFHSYYVALSRGFTAEGTVIIQDFSKDKIACGISGHLRQEYRDLEILDEITKLRYLGKLPRSVSGIYRRRLIRSYYAWKTDHRDPAHFHPEMRWNHSMGPRVPEPLAYSEWKPSTNGKNKRKNPTRDQEQQPAMVRKRQKSENDDLMQWDRAYPNRPESQTHIQQRRRPVGLIWNSTDWSCAYDTLLTILGNLWMEDNNRWTNSFAYLSDHLGNFATAMSSVRDRRITFEAARNIVRRELHRVEPNYFPYGQMGASIDRLANNLLPSKFYGIGRQICEVCGYRDARPHGILESYLSAGLSTRQEHQQGVHLQEWLEGYLRRGKEMCARCRQDGVRSRLTMQTTLTDAPSVMLIDIDHEKLIFDERLLLHVGQQEIRMNLRGIVYGGQAHFTCRLVDKDGSMWFHDGITTGSNCIPEINTNALQNKLLLHGCGEKQVVAVIYARD